MSSIRKAFVSRFGDEGVLLEADFSQLEIIALAFLSQDPKLIHDINNNVDIHSINAANLFGSNFTAKQRKTAKALSFQLTYGSGAYNMAKTNGISESKAKLFIENFYRRYPRVKDWQDENIELVKESRELSDERTDSGLPAGRGVLRSVTGREYVFYEKDSPEWMQHNGVMTSFNPTTIKNYPVQGFATADIVPLVLGKLYRNIKQKEEWRGKVLLVNTVHDSVLLDLCKEFVVECASLVKDVMESAPEYLKEEFGIEFNLPLKAELKIGPNWLEMEEYTV